MIGVSKDVKKVAKRITGENLPENFLWTSFWRLSLIPGLDLERRREANRSGNNQQQFAQTRDYFFRRAKGIQHDIRTRYTPNRYKVQMV